MIRIITIDDEPLALKLLEVYASRICDLELAASCQSVSEARKALEQSAPVDCIFTDINMPEVTGLEFVRGLENPPMIVFTTAYSEYAIEGFRVNAIDYLLKPFGFKDFQGAVDKVRRQKELIEAAQAVSASDTRPSPAAGDRVLFFKVGHQRLRLLASEILYVESLGAYLKLFGPGQEPYIVLGSLKSLLDAAPESFLRIHKSFLVNRDKIRQGGKTSVTLTGGTQIPVGEAYRKELLEIYG